MPLPSSAFSPGRRLLRNEAYEQLRALIVEGILQPGEPLRDAELGRWLGASRTPVREALTRLVDDGLVEMAPNRYTRVRALSVDTAREAHLLLGLLEGELGAAAAGSPDTDLTAMRAQSERFVWATWRGDRDEALAAECELHATLRRAVSSSSLLVRAVERADAHARRAQRNAWPTIVAGWPADAHPALIRALEDGDAAAARAAVAGEWRVLGDALLEHARDSSWP